MHEAGLADGIKLALISMGDTLRSNLSVGCRRTCWSAARARCVSGCGGGWPGRTPYLLSLREAWGGRLREIHAGLPMPDWLPCAAEATAPAPG